MPATRTRATRARTVRPREASRAWQYTFRTASGTEYVVTPARVGERECWLLSSANSSVIRPDVLYTLRGFPAAVLADAQSGEPLTVGVEGAMAYLRTSPVLAVKRSAVA